MSIFDWLRSRASEEDIEELEEQLDNMEEDLDQVLELVKENRGDLADLEEDTRRIDQVVEDLQEELEDDSQIDLDGMEQEIFKILMRAEEELTNSEIGERMDPERSGDQVRPKINDLKKKVTILEEKKGRAKAYAIPSKVKTDYLEKGQIPELSPGK